MTSDISPDAPDFAGLYGDGASALSPRVAWFLWTTAIALADTYREDDMWDLLEAELPPVAQRLADHVWTERFVSCFEALAARLARGGFESSQLASCTGEEMALHLVIDFAESETRDGVIPTNALLPEDVERDDDFEWIREALFRDHDVLLLFNASLDGIEDDESELNQQCLFANLHPQQWFIPFADQIE